MTEDKGYYLLGEICRIKGMTTEALTWDSNSYTTRLAERKVLEMIKAVCDKAISKINEVK